MAQVRHAAVAGAFYPDDPGELRALVSELLEQARSSPPAKAIVAPHAGYVYSGPIAASAFRCVSPGVRRVVLLGPSHFAALRGVAAPRADVFETPLGRVPIEVPEGIARSDAPHLREHSLEVEVPFLQVVLPEFTLVPIAVGNARPAEVADVIARAWGGAETVVVTSSDLSHYLGYEEARRTDEDTARRIERLVPVADDAACGAAPLNGLLFEAARRGLRCERLDLRNSGDTAGDRRRVVGYGAFALREAA
ncbi:MAG TPA: AmmeMemoRadiSam system protein B [Myxococcales bacterium]|nr:AmmeMemoRadiSam system protein B [Myxococcales bacterium]